ncbi:hypothetical protein [Methylophaga sp. OBS3]|uniref:hypothetical protein n=1 Tax=Methylophaga sp. OBS3 TaxID=2991934 RepID=UPI00224F68E0|nr:hypothetical protein [Methylophaga sp. OBS3]MCX4190823.1 hypothetical protein [Methylophaga sp. OBS3]
MARRGIGKMLSPNVSNYSIQSLNQATKEAYKEFSDEYGYVYSVTLTFPYKVGKNYAFFCLNEFFSKLQKKAFGKNALKKIRKEKPSDVAIQFGLEYKRQIHFHLRVRYPSVPTFREGFKLKSAIKSIWKESTNSRQIDIQNHYSLPSGYNFFDYLVKEMGVSFEDLDEFYWDQ